MQTTSLTTICEFLVEKISRAGGIIPKWAVFSLTVIIFSIDHVIGITYRPWWDVLLFMFGLSNVLLYLIISPLTNTVVSFDFYSAIILTIIKLIYLLNYVMREAHIPSLVVGLSLGMLLVALSTIIEYYQRLRGLYASVSTIYSRVGENNSKIQMENVIGGISELFSAFTDTNKGRESTKINRVVNEHIENDDELLDNPEDLDDAVNAALENNSPD